MQAAVGPAKRALGVVKGAGMGAADMGQKLVKRAGPALASGLVAGLGRGGCDAAGHQNEHSEN